MTEISDRFRRPLCGNDELRAVGRHPYPGYREEALGQRIFTNDLPTRVQVLRASERFVTERADGTIHRIEWVGLAGERGEFRKFVKRLGDGGDRLCAEGLCLALGVEPGHRHPVHGEGSGLVHA